MQTIHAAALALSLALGPVCAGAQGTGAETPQAGAHAAADDVHAATDPEALREARLLAEKTGGKEMTRNILHALRGQLVALIGQRGKSPEESAKIVDEILMPEMEAHLGELQDAAAHAWAAHLSAQEIRDLQAFYDTKLGRKLISVQPEISREMIGFGMAWGKRVAQETIRTHADELRRRGVNL